MSKVFPYSSLYAITDTIIAGCRHEEIVAAVAQGGGRLVQLREKDASTRDFYHSAQAAVAVARAANLCLIINDRVDIAMMVGADGVHLGQDDLSPEKARSLLGEDAIIGLSTHSLAQALAADLLPVDYIAVGPIFRTETKIEASVGVSGGQVGLDLLRAVRAAVNKPVVAIGGISLARAPSVLRAGADSVAVISDLLKHGNIAARTGEFIDSLVGIKHESLN
jgi:thiamine-phosphate pyrophosphorylase